MKIWGVFCLFGCISALEARVIDASDRSDVDERSGLGVATHFEEESQGGSSKDQKPELSSFLKENAENPSQEEIEKPDFLIVTTSEKSSPPAAGSLLLDPHVVSEQIFFPTVEAPWWERWWGGVKEWFYGAGSEV